MGSLKLENMIFFRSIIFFIKFLFLSLLEYLSFIKPKIEYQVYLIFYLTRKKANYANRLFSDSTRLVLDGFPRSGNSFLVRIVKIYSELNEGEIVHHHHNLIVLNYAIEFIPTLKIYVPVRNKYDSAKSLAKYYKISTFVAAWRYNIFYQGLARIKDRVILIDFKLLNEKRYVEIFELLEIDSPKDFDEKLVFSEVKNDADLIHGSKGSLRTGIPEGYRNA
jgi:hypothetical protein